MTGRVPLGLLGRGRDLGRRAARSLIFVRREEVAQPGAGRAPRLADLSGLPVTGLNELVLEVADLDAAARFYGETLGLPQLSRSDNRAWFLVGERSRIGLWTPQVGIAGGQGGAHVHYAMHVDEEDYDAAVARLREHGLDVARGGLRGERPRRLRRPTRTATSSSSGRGRALATHDDARLDQTAAPAGGARGRTSATTKALYVSDRRRRTSSSSGPWHGRRCRAGRSGSPESLTGGPWTGTRAFRAEAGARTPHDRPRTSASSTVGGRAHQLLRFEVESHVVTGYGATEDADATVRPMARLGWHEVVLDRGSSSEEPHMRRSRQDRTGRPCGQSESDTAQRACRSHPGRTGSRCRSDVTQALPGGLTGGLCGPSHGRA